MNDNVKFLSKGLFISKNEACQRPIMVIGSSDPKLAQTFDSEEEFHKWIDETDNTKRAERVYEIEKTVALIRQRQYGSDHTRARQRLQATIDRVTRELSELAAHHSLDPQEAGYDLFLKATVERDLLEPPIFDPFILCEHVGLKGRWLPVGFMVSVPDFRWLLWDNIGSSVAVYGAGCLWQDAWFQGPRIYFWGAPWAFNLTDFGWNDRASCAIGA